MININIKNLITNCTGKEDLNYQVGGPQEIPKACTHKPTTSDLHQHNIQLNSLDFDCARGSALTLQQEILCSLAIHSCQVASQLLPIQLNHQMSMPSPTKCCINISAETKSLMVNAKLSDNVLPGLFFQVFLYKPSQIHLHLLDSPA